MSVSVADIDRWDAGDVREVFHATRSQAEAAFEAANGIAELPAFGTWGGAAAETAKEAIGRTRVDLDDHGNEVRAVAQAASRAADDIEQVKSDLAQLRADAEHLGMTVDPISNTIEPGPGVAGASPIEVELKQMQLQPRLDAILAHAAEVDDELARAIAMAVGGQVIDKQNGDPEMLTGQQALDDLLRANDKGVVAAAARVKAAQDAVDKAAAAAYTYGPGSPEAEAALAKLPQLREDLAKALDDLGKIPDYSGIDPKSITVDGEGNVFFSYPLNGQMVQVTGKLKDGTGEIFDQGRLAYLTYENRTLVGTRYLDEGRAIADPEPLLSAVTTAVGAGPLIKGGEGAWVGLRALFGSEAATAVPETVLTHGGELATLRAEAATSHLATLGPGSWTPVAESMSGRAAAYQMQITGHPSSDGYLVNGVKFDGFSNGVLTDAKGYYSQFIQDGAWKPWFNGDTALLSQAERQLAVAQGTPVRWVFAEADSAAVVRQMLTDNGITGIDIAVIPPK